MSGKLVSEDSAAEARRRAVSEIHRTADTREALERLLAALADPDWRVRKEAVDVGERLAARVAMVAPLIEVIAHTDDVGHRNAALELIGRIGQASVKSIAEALDHVPPNSRKFVIAALGEAGRHEDVIVLEQLLVDPDPNVKAAVLEAISRLGGPDAERILAARLGAEDAFDRIAALDGLERLRAKVPLDALLPLLDDKLSRKMAIQLIGRAADPRGLPPLVAALSDAAAANASAAVLSLGRLGDASMACTEALHALVRRFTDGERVRVEAIALHGEPSVRPYAVRLLLLAHDPRGLAPAVDLASNDALGARELVALREWGMPAVPPLLAHARAVEGRAHASAVELAAYVAQEHMREAAHAGACAEVRAALRADIRHDDVEVRLGAARAFLDWAEAVDAEALTEATRRGPDEVARAAGQALEALADRHQAAVRQSLAPVRLSGPGGAALTSVVARLKDDNVVDRLRDALAAEDPVTRRSAVEALGSVGGADAADAIGMALADENPEVQATAARVLGGLRGEQGEPLGMDRLLGAVRAPEPAVRAAVARTLGDVHDARAREALVALLEDEDSGVVIAAMEGLRTLGDAVAAASIERFLDSADEEVLKQALWCLAELDPKRAAPALVRALEHAAWDVRQLSAMLLGESRDPRALEALRARLAKEDYDLVREAIMSAMVVAEGAR